MGVLRLLYCDSAGVRRCRAVVHKGELPVDGNEEKDATQAADGATAVPKDPNMLPTTPSLLEAAAAGVISLANTVTGAATTSTQQQLSPAQHSAAALTQVQAATAGPFATQTAALAAVPDGETASALDLTHSGNLKRAGRSHQLCGVSAAVAAAARVAARYGIGLTAASMGQPVNADMMVPGSGLCPVGEVRLIPDLSAVQALPWAEGHSIAPAEMWERDLSRPSPLCPRAALKHALSALELAHDIRLQLGFELEFTLLRPAAASEVESDGEGPGLVLRQGGRCWVPVDDSIYCQSSAFDQMAPVLDKMVATLQSMGIKVQQYHAESGPGQFELATAPYPALEAVDKLLLSKEAISAVARQNGLEVTFMPKLYNHLAGSGCHCHISLWQAHPKCRHSSGSTSSYDSLSSTTNAVSSDGTSDVSLMTVAPGTVPVGRSSYASGQCAPEGYPTLSNTAAAFLAGLLEHLPGLLPFTAPTNNSFARLKPGTWSGAHICWGYDNREAPLRVCCPDPDKPESANIEYKAFDGTCNPYIGVSAIVAAGMRGLQEASVLPSPVQVVPGTDDTTATLKALPGSLTEASTALDKDNSLQIKLQQLLGPDLLKAFLAVRRYEAENIPAQPCSTLLRYS